jgi:histidinol-phosphate aminotransferase
VKPAAEGGELDRRLNPAVAGIKPYVPGLSIEEARRLLGRGSFIKMASNENPLGIAPAAAQAIRRAVRRSFQYPEVEGHALRLALAGRLGAPPECLILGNGADSILYTLALTLLAEADEVLIPELTYSYYELLARAFRARIVRSAAREFRPDLQDLAARITPATKLAFVCNPNNPTGAVIPRQELETFLDRLPEGVFAVVDEVYADFCDPALLADTLERIRAGSRNLIVVRSFSKAYGLAGVRLGCGVACDELVERMHRMRPPFDVSVLAQAAGLGALQDRRFLRRTVSLARRERERLRGRLTTLGLACVPSHTNFLLVDTGTDARAVAEQLLRRGFIVRAGLSPKLGSFIRITLGRRRQNERLVRALAAVLRLG